MSGRATLCVFTAVFLFVFLLLMSVEFLPLTLSEWSALLWNVYYDERSVARTLCTMCLFFLFLCSYDMVFRKNMLSNISFLVVYCTSMSVFSIGCIKVWWIYIGQIRTTTCKKVNGNGFVHMGLLKHLNLKVSPVLSLRHWLYLRWLMAFFVQPTLLRLWLRSHLFLFLFFMSSCDIHLFISLDCVCDLDTVLAYLGHILSQSMTLLQKKKKFFFSETILCHLKRMPTGMVSMVTRFKLRRCQLSFSCLWFSDCMFPWDQCSLQPFIMGEGYYSSSGWAGWTWLLLCWLLIKLNVGQAVAGSRNDTWYLMWFIFNWNHSFLMSTEHWGGSTTDEKIVLFSALISLICLICVCVNTDWDCVRG